MADQPFMSLRGISKRYGTSRVLRDIDLDIRAGSGLAITGENGAGKSTLVRLATGVEQPSTGGIAIEGEPVVLATPRDAKSRGIAVIPQELAYLPQLSVAENIALANWPRNRVTFSRTNAREQARRALARLGVELDVRAPMEAIGLAERQLVEIAKALTINVKMLVLDEPTASLHGHEAARLLDLLDGLKTSGVAIVYISHRLDECFRVAERIAVLRNGALAASLESAGTSAADVITHMLGRDYHEPDMKSRPATASATPLLRAVDWRSSGAPALRGVSFEVRPGEVLGVFGILGSGAEVVARGLGGDAAGLRGGLFTGDGAAVGVPHTPVHARAIGIAYVPAERKSEGLALSRSVAEHLVLQTPRTVSHLGVVVPRREAAAAHGLVARFQVRCTGVGQPVGALSGGNQQKVLLASRLAAVPPILVLHEPTRGVDIGARAQVHQFLVEAARAGAAVVLVTADVAEAVAVTDRLLVIRDGLVADELIGARKEQSSALEAAAGGLS